MSITNEELIHEWRKVTGWSIEKVREELPKLNCNYRDALKIYMCAGRMPTDNEQVILKECGFYAWEALWKRTML